MLSIYTIWESLSQKTILATVPLKGPEWKHFTGTENLYTYNNVSLISSSFFIQLGIPRGWQGPFDHADHCRSAWALWTCDAVSLISCYSKLCHHPVAPERKHLADNRDLLDRSITDQTKYVSTNPAYYCTVKSTTQLIRYSLPLSVTRCRSSLFVTVIRFHYSLLVTVSHKIVNDTAMFRTVRVIVSGGRPWFVLLMPQ